MSAKKGCVNKKCVACQKRILYKKSYEYCLKCGKKLQYVCKKCHKQLPDNSQKFCNYHLAQREDKRNHITSTGLKVGGLVLTGLAALAGSSKPALTKFKKK